MATAHDSARESSRALMSAIQASRATSLLLGRQACGMLLLLPLEGCLQAVRCWLKACSSASQLGGGWHRGWLGRLWW